MDTAKIARNMSIDHNVTIRVLDAKTLDVVSTHEGHNQGTNSMLLGIAHYLLGDGVLNQANSTLSDFLPKYMSLGTMGLMNQDETDDGLPAGVGNTPRSGVTDAELNTIVSHYADLGRTITSDEAYDILRYTEYKDQQPGYGADGYDSNQNNGRYYLGLGPVYSGSGDAVRCELISSTFPRSKITYRQIIPETESESPETIDIVLSAMISTGALAQFRNGKDHIFITEAGLWAKPNYSGLSDNGLLAGYRIMPSDKDKWDMQYEENRKAVDASIIRVGINQVVQVIWKLQIGAPYDLLGEAVDMREYYTKLEADAKFALISSVENKLYYEATVSALADLPDIQNYHPNALIKVEETGKSYFKATATATSWTTLYDASGEGGSDVGESTEGMSFTVDETTYTAGVGSERFNDYTDNASIGQYSHVEGHATFAVGNNSHAEGYNNKAMTANSHAEGENNTASGGAAHAEGGYTTASGTASHAEGSLTTASGNISHAEGNGSTASGSYAHAEGYNTTASENTAHAEGTSTIASASQAHAEGLRSQATGLAAHAEGDSTEASGGRSHAEGLNTKATEYCTHAEGQGTTASYDRAHAEGFKTTASNYSAHAEGTETTASGHSAHSEGNATTASGNYSHAGGNNSTASGLTSFAHGLGVQSGHDFESSFGEYNRSSSDTLFSVGNGTSDNARNNAFEVKNSGDVRSSGYYYDKTGHALVPVVFITEAEYEALAVKEPVIYAITDTQVVYPPVS